MGLPDGCGAVLAGRTLERVDLVGPKYHDVMAGQRPGRSRARPTAGMGQQEPAGQRLERARAAFCGDGLDSVGQAVASAE